MVWLKSGTAERLDPASSKPDPNPYHIPNQNNLNTNFTNITQILILP